MANITYTSGDAARMLGISQEAIRYYEKQGIVLFEKEDGNGYRFFQFRKLIAMVCLRLLQRMGFSVQDSWELVNGTNTGRIVQRLEENEAELEAQIVRLTQIQSFSSHCRKEIASIPRHLNQISVRQIPEFYHIKFQNDRKVIKDKQYQQIVQTWHKHSPVVQAGLVAPLDRLLPGYQAEVGFGIWQVSEKPWVHADHPAVQKVPGGPALYMIAKVEPDCTGFCEPMLPMIEYVQLHSIPTKNLILAVPLAMRCRLDESQPMKDYYQVYVPLAD